MTKNNQKRFIKLTAVGPAHFRTPAEIKDEKTLRKKIIAAVDKGTGLDGLYNIIRLHRKGGK